LYLVHVAGVVLEFGVFGHAFEDAKQRMRVMQWWAIPWLIWVVVSIFAAFLNAQFLSIDDLFVLFDCLYQFVWILSFLIFKTPFALCFFYVLMLFADFIAKSTSFNCWRWLMNSFLWLSGAFIEGKLRFIIVVAKFKWFAVATAVLAGFFVWCMMLMIIDFLQNSAILLDFLYYIRHHVQLFALFQTLFWKQHFQIFFHEDLINFKWVFFHAYFIVL
jgi:hypothetical protein